MEREDLGELLLVRLLLLLLDCDCVLRAYDLIMRSLSSSTGSGLFSKSPWRPMNVRKSSLVAVVISTLPAIAGGPCQFWR